MNIYTQLKKMTPSEYFAYLTEAINKFKNTPDAIEFTFDFRCMNYIAYDESAEIVTQEDIVKFLEAADVLPAFGTGSFPISHVGFAVYKANFKGKMVMYCTINENYRYFHPKTNPAYNGNAEF